MATLAGDDGSLFDLLVVYTPAARDEAGGTNAMRAVVNLAMSEANQAYADSGVPARLRLVHLAEIDFTESGNDSADLNALQGDADGQADEVHALRDLHGADVVVMLGVFTGTCGRAFAMSALSAGFEANAFSIVTWNCAIGNYSFAHEIAHNMGCRHQREDTSGTPLYDYAFGWAFPGLGGNDYRTIMATVNAPGIRVPRFSNPDLLFEGTATGMTLGESNQAHNALTLINAATVVSQWRPTTHALDVTPRVRYEGHGPLGGPLSPAAQSYTLTNLGPVALNWAVHTTADWFTVAPTGGVLAAGAAQEVALELAPDAVLLAANTYVATLIFSNTGSGFIAQRPAVLRVGDVARLPFTEDFESGALGPCWTVGGTWQHRTEVSQTNDPHAGTYHLTMDDTYGSSSSFTSRNEMTLAVDLARFTNVVLSFWARDYADEVDEPPAPSFAGGQNFDGVAVSLDGTNWFVAGVFTNLTSSYAEQTMNLDDVMDAYGIWYTNRTYIRFNHYDNYPIPSDGIALDDMSLVGDARYVEGPVLHGVQRAASDDAMVLRWFAESGAVYRVERAGQWPGSSSVRASNLSASVPFTSYTDAIAGVERAFYSVTREQ